VPVNLDICAAAALDKELELAVVSLSYSGVKSSCEMVTVVLVSSCAFFDEGGICLLKNVFVV